MIILLALGFVFGIIATTLLRGFALMTLWGWFVVHKFNLSPLSLAEAAGLALLISFTTLQFHDYEKEKKSTSEKMAELFITSIVGSLFALFFGWLIHLFL